MSVDPTFVEGSKPQHLSFTVEVKSLVPIDSNCLASGAASIPPMPCCYKAKTESPEPKFRISQFLPLTEWFIARESLEALRLTGKVLGFFSFSPPITDLMAPSFSQLPKTSRGLDICHPSVAYLCEHTFSILII